MPPTLVVPVTLDALVLNDAVKGANSFRIWQRGYTALEGFGSPDPEAASGQITDPAYVHTGVHLHWTLPRGLRHGVQDQHTGQLTYPLVPNRWLVTRFSGTATRRAKYWVIESDCPYTDYADDQGGHDDTFSSDQVVGQDTFDAWNRSDDPYRNDADPNSYEMGFYQIPIGLCFGVEDTGSWRERAADVPPFLTAIGAGDPYFASYTPNNSNIFSFIDDLADITSQATLGYHVVGWYSDPGSDILATLPEGTTYSELLARLGWQDPRLTGDPDHNATVTAATRSLYSGQALKIAWDPNGQAPSDDPLRQIQDAGALDVAIGNTAEDAFAALAGRAVAGAGSLTAAEMQLLRAFLYDLLPLADENGGDAKVRRRIRNSWFGAAAGGYRWTLTPPPADDGGAPRTFTAPDWLDGLNDAQGRLEEKLGELASLQWRLNAMWHKYGQNVNDGIWWPDDAPTADEMAYQLDSANADSLARQVRDLTAEVCALTRTVPQPDEGAHPTANAAWRAGIAAFAATGDLPEGARLKAIPKPSFWQSNNPVLALSGMLPPPDTITDDQPLPVRLLDSDTSSLISRVTVDGKGITATVGRNPMPDIPIRDALPDGALALLAECFLLDPGNATVLATAAGVSVTDVTRALAEHDPAAYTGTLPALGLSLWSQPWQPLFVEWKAHYLPIPYSANSRRCWSFDGTDYRYVPDSAPTPKETIVVGGISGLSPHPRRLFADRLTKFVTNHGTSEQRDQLEEWLTAIGGWGFLAQEMTGFNDLLGGRDPRAHRRPMPTDPTFPEIADLAGYPGSGTPDGLPERYRGRVASVTYLPGGTDPYFQETRQGQIYFETLFVYDKFGRMMDVVNPSTKYGGLRDFQSFPFVIDDAFATESSLDTQIASVAQLPPRPLQPARLDFDLLDGMTGRRVVGTDAEANPIGGWVLPNHLDRSLLLYDPMGRLLGSYRLFATGSQRTGKWEPPPEGTVTTLDDVATLAPVVAGLIGSPQLATEANFTAFLDVIDSTLWGTDPLGARADRNLSVLIGRPLALVPAQLRLSLDGAPLFDPSLAATIDPPAPAFTGHEFAVRLGDLLARDDGLVGYFTTGSDGAYRFDRFNSVTAPDDGQDYATQIGPLGPCEHPNYLQLTFGDSGPTKLLLLMDPRADVHAVTGITPTGRAAVAPSHVQTPMDRIEALFHFGPALTVPDTSAHTVAFPQPSEKHGDWSWLRPRPGNSWTPFTLTPVVPTAQFPDHSATIEDGLLRFTTDLDHDHTDTPDQEPAQ